MTPYIQNNVTSSKESFNSTEEARSFWIDLEGKLMQFLQDTYAIAALQLEKLQQKPDTEEQTEQYKNKKDILKTARSSRLRLEIDFKTASTLHTAVNDILNSGVFGLPKEGRKELLELVNDLYVDRKDAIAWSKRNPDKDLLRIWEDTAKAIGYKATGERLTLYTQERRSVINATKTMIFDSLVRLRNKYEQNIKASGTEKTAKIPDGCKLYQKEFLSYKIDDPLETLRVWANSWFDEDKLAPAPNENTSKDVIKRGEENMDLFCSNHLATQPNNHIERALEWANLALDTSKRIKSSSMEASMQVIINELEAAKETLAQDKKLTNSR